MFATNEKTLISLLCPPETLGGTLALLNVVDPVNGVLAPILMGYCLDKFGNSLQNEQSYTDSLYYFSYYFFHQKPRETVFSLLKNECDPVH